MPSVAGMGLEFSCGEDPKLVPAVATGAEPHGAAPEERGNHDRSAERCVSRVGAHREPLMTVRPSPSADLADSIDLTTHPPRRGSAGSGACG